MLLEVRHVTRYQYDEMVRESVMEVWMQPAKRTNQRLVSFELEVEPPAQLFSYADNFGNAVYHFDVPQPHERLTIVARSAVEISRRRPLPDILDRGEWDRLKSDFVRGEHFDFLHPHGYAGPGAALDAFVAEKKLDELREPQSAARRARALAYCLRKSFGYEAGVTRADLPDRRRAEVTQGGLPGFRPRDDRHLLVVGRPGALRFRATCSTDRKSGDRSDPDATHAWVEVFLPSLRWIGLDPTNDIIAGERHIACAVGRDYRDVPPPRAASMLQGRGGERTGGGRHGAQKPARRLRRAGDSCGSPRPRSRAGQRRNQFNGAVYEQQRQQQQQ